MSIRLAHRFVTVLLPTTAAALLAGSLAFAVAPEICTSATARPNPERMPAPVGSYLDSLGSDPFNQRVACARWAGTFSNRHERAAAERIAGKSAPARLIVFPAAGVTVAQLAGKLGRMHSVTRIERARSFVVAAFKPRTSGAHLSGLLDASFIQYAEPDCDGPDFLTTSLELMEPGSAARNCWQRSARAEFPNDPCMDELWGHRLIGWDSGVAARSLPRVVAVLDSGIDAAHEDLASNVVLREELQIPLHSFARRLNDLCATSGRCYPHGTEMAGTIGGRMDNGIGIAGVAPNSHLLPIVISRIGRGLLSRLSTIAAAIDAAALDDADVINISAKWPVDSRAISEAIRSAVGGEQARRRLIVTGYATSLDSDDSVREYFPSQYRCLPGVLAAVPADMRGHDLFNPKGQPNANDGRIQAPGVDIVVTTTENSERGYALSGAAGASSAAAYVSGAVALVWGSPPLNKCDAQQIKRVLFCRSKSSDSTRYPWVHVDFLRELSNLDPGADCGAAMEALGCN